MGINALALGESWKFLRGKEKSETTHRSLEEQVFGETSILKKIRWVISELSIVQGVTLPLWMGNPRHPLWRLALLSIHPATALIYCFFGSYSFKDASGVPQNALGVRFTSLVP